MADPAYTVSELDGRTWSDDSNGKIQIKRRFRITGLTAGFSISFNYTGLPKVGDALSTGSSYKCMSREFAEGEGSAKTTVIVTCTYGTENAESGGSGQEGYSCVVDEWGWDSATEEGELTTAQDGTAILNSAGDPFDSVPRVSNFAPTFTKIMRFKTRQGSAMACNCCVNGSSVTIGGRQFPEGSLLASVSEKRIFGDAEYKYQYIIQLRYKFNLVKVEGGSSAEDIGWDVAVTDTGMRELVDGVPKLITVIDKETGKPCKIQSPALLDGQGKAQMDNPEPYNFRFQAYNRATFPAWFYSEPN